MAHHDDHRDEPVREREVIVTDNGRGGGGGAGAVIAAIVGVLVVLLLAFLLFGGFGGGDGGGTGEGVDVEAPSVDVPDEVNVDVEGGGTEG